MEGTENNPYGVPEADLEKELLPDEHGFLLSPRVYSSLPGFVFWSGFLGYVLVGFLVIFLGNYVFWAFVDPDVQAKVTQYPVWLLLQMLAGISILGLPMLAIFGFRKLSLRLRALPTSEHLAAWLFGLLNILWACVKSLVLIAVFFFIDYLLS